jgi:glutamyl-tRNA reductase
LQRLKVIAFTHKRTPLKELNRFFLHEENRKERLDVLKYTFDINEIFYVATCNLIEFVFSCFHKCDDVFLKKFFQHFRDDWTSEEVDFAVKHAEVFEGDDALRHLFRVASSLDSMVVGEREIITQVRKAYDLAKSEGLTGDFLRLVVKSIINTAKQVYTETKIAVNPVSVVSLAERELRERKLSRDSRILIIGAGDTNTNLCKYLVKQGYSNFIIFNRTLDNAKKLADSLSNDSIKASAYSLNELGKYKKGFDLLVVCTSSPEKFISRDLYSSLLNGDKNSKVIIDLSVPSNIDPVIIEENATDLIDISNLRNIAEQNLIERENEIEAAEEIVDENINVFHHLNKTRKVEIKMKEVPQKIREIKDQAINHVFADDISGMDEHSKEVLTKVLNYMEKKCISIPMIMAKEIILESTN